MRLLPRRLSGRTGGLNTDQLEGAIYGAVIVTAVVVGESLDHEVSPYAGAVSVAVTAIVYWLAHVYAREMAYRLVQRRQPTLREAARVALDQWPIVEAGIVPVILLVLGGLGLYGRELAFNLAMAAGVVSLFLWGVAFARREEEGWGGVLLSGVFTATLGLAIVGLKAFV